ncbi:MAG: YkvA family protein [Lapillicoccus sp.]
MARHTTRLGLLTMVAGSVRTAMRPGSAGLAERAAAVPRMLRAVGRGEYRGTTFGHVALLAAAVAYVVSPLDLVPEAVFGIFGIADDAVVVTWLAAALVADTEAYLVWERATGRAGATSDARGSARGDRGPQDVPADEYRHTVRSQVVR